MSQATQHAILFTGAEELVHEPAKAVTDLRPHDIRLKVDACGICFSDTKLLHAFVDHPRKSRVTRVVADPAGAAKGGFDPADDQASMLAELDAMSQYVPGDVPTVPGHEPTAHIVEVGSAVTNHHVGERVLVQTDYRHLPTAGSNAAFGYNFEGALQQTVVVDERVVTEPETGDRFLIPVAEGPSSSAIALIEPWACVEAAYAWGERQAITDGSRLLVVVDAGRTADGLGALLAAAKLASVDVIGDAGAAVDGFEHARHLDAIGDGTYDDIVYFGSDAATLEQLGTRLGFRGLLAYSLNGQRLDRPVQIDVGRVHYDLIRFVGTTGSDIAEAYTHIPAVSELRPGEKVAIIGAAGPMGLMHTMRTAVSGVAGVSMDAVDVDDARLAHLAETVAPVAAKHGVPAVFHNSANSPLKSGYTYVAVMVPAPALIAQAVDITGDGAIVNAFAGFAVGTTAPLDLNVIAERGVYLVGTSGSRIRDMRAVLAKVESGVIDTNVSLFAVCGMEGVADAIASVKNRTSTGKIMVYPQLTGMGLVPLADLPRVMPGVAAAMDNGRWTKEAEAILLAKA